MGAAQGLDGEAGSAAASAGAEREAAAKGKKKKKMPSAADQLAAAEGYQVCEPEAPGAGAQSGSDPKDIVFPTAAAAAVDAAQVVSQVVQGLVGSLEAQAVSSKKGAPRRGAGSADEPEQAYQSVVLEAAAKAIHSGQGYKPNRGGVQALQIAKLRRASYGPTLEAWIAYERLLRICEPCHVWRWMPDARLSDFWRSLPPEQQAACIEVKSDCFRNLINEHTDMRTCYIKDMMAVCNDVYMLDDTHSIAVFQEFFRITVSENVCIAVNWQTVQAIDSTIQDFIKARVSSGELTHRVDPRDFPKGSYMWCQHREREHTRLALMTLALEIFERRLLGMWESRPGATRRRVVQLSEVDVARMAAEQAQEELLGMEDSQAAKKAGKSKKKKKKAAAGSGEAADGGAADGGAAAGEGEEAEAEAPEAPRPCEAECCGADAAGKPAATAKSKARRRKGKGQDAARQAEGGEELEEELQLAQNRVDKEDGDEIDAEFNRLVLEHLKARAVAAQDTSIDSGRSASVIKNLCQKLEVSLQSSLQSAMSQGPMP